MDMICDLALLLATLSIMTAALVITGVPTKLGSLLIEAAGVNLAAMVLMAFIFGAILGTGLPPAPTYILVAIVIAPPMIQAGVNPWVVHFFAFFLACFGELTPPTSLVAAVTAKIANASFYSVLNRAMQICISLFTLMVAVFVHPELVIKPGLDQIGAAILVGIATIGMSFTLQAKFSDSRPVDIDDPRGERGVRADRPVRPQLHHRLGSLRAGADRDRLLAGVPAQARSRRTRGGRTRRQGAGAGRRRQRCARPNAMS